MALSSFALAVAALVTDAPVHAGGNCSSWSAAPSSNAGDIVDIASSAGDFTTLVSALKAADLVDDLRGSGPFTVFAPADSAFARLPRGTVDSLLARGNRAQLIAVLGYHVVPGRLTAADIRQRSGAETLSGQRLDFRARGRSLKIDGARIVKSDISADNGIIHVIDQVLKPSTHDLVTLAREAGKFSTLLAALDAAALSEVLRGGGPFTVFAPTDKAFSRLGPDTVTALLRPENRDQLIAVLKNHVVSGRVYAEQAASAGAVHTLAGTGLRFAVNSGRLQVNGVRLLDTDRDADNGVIHVVDRVLVPML